LPMIASEVAMIRSRVGRARTGFRIQLRSYHCVRLNETLRTDDGDDEDEEDGEDEDEEEDGANKKEEEEEEEEEPLWGLTG
jgi:hypothetical protein